MMVVLYFIVRNLNILLSCLTKPVDIHEAIQFAIERYSKHGWTLYKHCISQFYLAGSIYSRKLPTYLIIIILI